MIFVDSGTSTFTTSTVISTTFMVMSGVSGTMTFTTASDPSYWWIDELAKPLPEFGWYNIFRPTEPVTEPVAPLLVWKHRKPQARRCHADARRWKRRRYLQALRRAA